MYICAFATVNNEKPKDDKEKMFTCVHGKTLTFQTARRLLGLKFEKAGTTYETEEAHEMEAV